MTARVHSTFSSSASAEQVFTTLTSPEWVATKAERFADGSRLTRHDVRPDGGVVLAVSRELPSGVPGFLERFLPQDGRVLETFDWAAVAAGGSRHGAWSAEIPGAPARLGGSMRIDATEVGSVYTIDGEVKVKVPLIGGRAESFIAEMVQRLAAKEAELLRETLGV